MREACDDERWRSPLPPTSASSGANSAPRIMGVGRSSMPGCVSRVGDGVKNDVLVGDSPDSNGLTEVGRETGETMRGEPLDSCEAISALVPHSCPVDRSHLTISLRLLVSASQA